MARKSRYQHSAQPAQQELHRYQAAQYGRLSDEDGDDIAQNSIGHQQRIADHFVAGQDDIEIVEYYFDNGYSGMNYNRPDFQRMMEDAGKGKINCIIVKDISRFGRDFISTSEYVEQILPNMGIRLICINDNYDSKNEYADANALMMPLKMVMNDSYVRDISKKIRSGITAKMNNGEFLPAAGSVPYGYLRNPKEMTYEIDPVSEAVVRRIFSMRANGDAFNKIAKALNADNIPCPGKLRYIRGETKALKYADALWIRGTVRKITNDQVYRGYRIHGKIKRDKLGLKKTMHSKETWNVIENAHPAIISEDLFEKVQSVNQEELRKRDGYKKRNDAQFDYRTLFQGKVICGECGHPLIAKKGCARIDAKTGSRIFYDCSEYERSHHTRCSSHYIRQEILMQTLKQTLQQQISIAADMEQVLVEIRTAGAKNCQTSKTTSLRIKRQNVEKRAEQLLLDLTTGLIDRDEYEYAKKIYEEQYNQIQSEEIAVQEAMRKEREQIYDAEKWAREIKRYQALPRVDRAMVDLLVRKISVFHDGSVRIELNYADPIAPLIESREQMKGQARVI